MISWPANGSVDDVHPTTHPPIDDPLATNRLIERRLRIAYYYHHTSGGVRPCVRVCRERASVCVCVCVYVRARPFVLAGARLCVRAAAGRYYCYYYRRRRRRPHIILLYLIYSRQSRVSCYVSVCVPCPFASFFFFFTFLPIPFIPRCDRNVNFFLSNKKNMS